MNEKEKMALLKAVKAGEVSEDEAVELLLKASPKTTFEKTPSTKPKVQDNLSSLFEELNNLLMDILKVESTDFTLDTAVIDIGLDSITATEFVKIVNQKYSVNMAPSVLFEFTTVRSFAKHLFGLINKENIKSTKSKDLNETEIVKKLKSNSKPVNKAKKEYSNIESIWNNLETTSAETISMENKKQPIYESQVPQFLLISQDNLPDIEVMIFGEGQPLLILGGLQSLDAWLQCANTLAQHYQIIIPNLPGFGRSELDADSISIETLLNAIKNILFILHIKKPLPVLGYSFGGILALSLALQKPDYFSSLIIACSTSDNTSLTIGFKTLLQEIAALNTESKHLLNQTDFDVMAVYGKIGKTFKITDQLSNIFVPTLIVAGENDHYMLPEFGNLMSQKIPSSTYTVVSEAGHFLPFTNAEEFNQLILNFLAEKNQL